MKSLVIGLGSKARIGKDYCVRELQKGYDIERISFADKLKEDLNKILKSQGVDFFELDKTPLLKEQWRPVMVNYGELMRTYDPDWWVKKALDKELKHQITMVVDVRYPNEVRKIKEMGGVYIEIESDTPPANETEALYSPQCAAMADHIVVNDFTINFLENLDSLVSYLLDKHDN